MGRPPAGSPVGGTVCRESGGQAKLEVRQSSLAGSSAAGNEEILVRKSSPTHSARSFFRRGADGMGKKLLRGLVLFLFLFLGQGKLSGESNAGWNALFGTASWYSESDPGINLRTANGEIFDDSKLTCASWDFPFGTYLRVTHLANGKAVLCRINDRGPAKRLDRLIDLTKRSFREIAPLETGLISVKVEVAGARESASRSRFQREALPLR